MAQANTDGFRLIAIERWGQPCYASGRWTHWGAEWPHTVQAMQTPREAVLLRIFVAEEDRSNRSVLYEEIVKKALAFPMAGATVLPAPEGFGHSRRIRTELCIDTGPHQPMVVEIVDTEETIERFLPVLDGMIDTGLLTLEKVQLFRYPADGRKIAAAGNVRP
jgi:uncharacterized protein